MRPSPSDSSVAVGPTSTDLHPNLRANSFKAIKGDQYQQGHFRSAYGPDLRPCLPPPSHQRRDGQLFMGIQPIFNPLMDDGGHVHRFDRPPASAEAPDTLIRSLYQALAD